MRMLIRALRSVTRSFEKRRKIPLSLSLSLECLYLRSYIPLLPRIRARRYAHSRKRWSLSKAPVAVRRVVRSLPNENKEREKNIVARSSRSDKRREGKQLMPVIAWLYAIYIRIAALRTRERGTGCFLCCRVYVCIYRHRFAVLLSYTLQRVHIYVRCGGLRKSRWVDKARFRLSRAITYLSLSLANEFQFRRLRLIDFLCVRARQRAGCILSLSLCRALALFPCSLSTVNMNLALRTRARSLSLRPEKFSPRAPW